MKVYVATYEHKFGSTVRVFDSFAKVQAWKDELGKKWWSSVFNLEDYPQPNDSCGDDYFDQASSIGLEFFNYEECKVE